jgi:hypothetical protein
LKQKIKNNKGEKKARRERMNETNKEKMNEKKIGKSLNKNGTMCEDHLRISLGRAEVCATVVVRLFLLSLPASVALFLTSVCLGSLAVCSPINDSPLFPFSPFISPKPLQTLPSLKVPDGFK